MPTLWAGKVGMHKLPAHSGPPVLQLIEGASCSVVYIPAYSPDCTGLGRYGVGLIRNSSVPMMN